MNIETLAANIKRIRSAKKISQSALAEIAGVSLPAIKNIEGAKNPPRVSTLQQIARALEIKLQDLFSPVNELVSVRFRANKKIQGREQILVNVSRWLDDFHFLEKALDLHVKYKFANAFTAADRRSPVKLAAKARKVLELKDDEPIHDICGLLENAGIKIYPFTYASDAFFGLAINEDSRGPAVVVNNWDRVSVERQIFSAAHELGHLLMHLGSFSVKDDLEDEREECEANTFAGYFLLPDDGFKNEWNDARGIPSIDRVMKVKRIFHVSYKTILYRLIEKGLADKSVWIKFNAAYQARYERKLPFKEEPSPSSPEPFGMERFDFYEDRLSLLVRQAVEAEAISISRGAEILQISVEEVQEQISDLL
jgi:Zn-dependent peptidase ImmA (M78 family)/DNA-binding XRE family transcriptional regulator